MVAVTTVWVSLNAGLEFNVFPSVLVSARRILRGQREQLRIPDPPSLRPRPAEWPGFHTNYEFSFRLDPAPAAQESGDWSHIFNIRIIFTVGICFSALAAFIAYILYPS